MLNLQPIIVIQSVGWKHKAWSMVLEVVVGLCWFQECKQEISCSKSGHEGLALPSNRTRWEPQKHQKKPHVTPLQSRFGWGFRAISRWFPGASSGGLSLDASIRNAALNLGGGESKALDSPRGSWWWWHGGDGMVKYWWHGGFLWSYNGGTPTLAINNGMFHYKLVNQPFLDTVDGNSQIVKPSNISKDGDRMVQWEWKEVWNEMMRIWLTFFSAECRCDAGCCSMVGESKSSIFGK